jgi:hypothetical protein
MTIWLKLGREEPRLQEALEMPKTDSTIKENSRSLSQRRLHSQLQTKRKSLLLKKITLKTRTREQ